MQVFLQKSLKKASFFPVIFIVIPIQHHSFPLYLDKTGQFPI